MVNLQFILGDLLGQLAESGVKLVVASLTLIEPALPLSGLIDLTALILECKQSLIKHLDLCILLDQQSM